MTWFRSTPESEALLAEERLVLAATEAVHDAMVAKGVNGQQLADLLNVRPSEVSQRLSGRRNLTLRSLAQMLHVLGMEADLNLRPSMPADLDGAGSGMGECAAATAAAGIWASYVDDAWHAPKLAFAYHWQDPSESEHSATVWAHAPDEAVTESSTYEAVGRLFNVLHMPSDESVDEGQQAVGCS